MVHKDTFSSGSAANGEPWPWTLKLGSNSKAL